MAALTAINGIGPATARALEAAGIADVAALADIDPAAPPTEAAGRVPRADWPGWVAAARAMTGAQAAGSEDAPAEQARDADAESAPAPRVEDVPAEGFGGLIPPAGASGGGPVAPPVPAAPPPVPAIRVRGPAGGFRRAGRHWGPDWTVLPLDALDEAAIAALRGEPKLVVEPVAPAEAAR